METITVVGERINSGITDPREIREFLENFGSNMNWGSNQGGGGRGGAPNREQDKDSGEDKIWFLVLKIIRQVNKYKM